MKDDKEELVCDVIEIKNLYEVNNFPDKCSTNLKQRIINEHLLILDSFHKEPDKILQKLENADFLLKYNCILPLEIIRSYLDFGLQCKLSKVQLKVFSIFSKMEIRFPTTFLKADMDFIKYMLKVFTEFVKHEMPNEVVLMIQNFFLPFGNLIPLIIKSELFSTINDVLSQHLSETHTIQLLNILKNMITFLSEDESTENKMCYIKIFNAISHLLVTDNDMIFDQSSTMIVYILEVIDDSEIYSYIYENNIDNIFFRRLSSSFTHSKKNILNFFKCLTGSTTENVIPLIDRNIYDKIIFFFNTSDETYIRTIMEIIYNLLELNDEVMFNMINLGIIDFASNVLTGVYSVESCAGASFVFYSLFNKYFDKCFDYFVNKKVLYLLYLKISAANSDILFNFAFCFYKSIMILSQSELDLSSVIKHSLFSDIDMANLHQQIVSLDQEYIIFDDENSKQKAEIFNKYCCDIIEFLSNVV